MLTRPECLAVLRWYQSELYNVLDNRRYGLGVDHPNTDEVDRILAGIAKWNDHLKTFEVGAENGAN